MQHATPAELLAVQRAIYRPGIPAREYVARQDEVAASAVAAIKEYAQALRGHPAIELMKLTAAMFGQSPEAEAVTALCSLFESGSEDAAGALDDAHKAVGRYAETYFEPQWI